MSTKSDLLKRFEAMGGTFRIKLHEEDVPLRGNVQASGDAEADKRAEAEVQAQLDAGNAWAWCTVEVVAALDGNFSASDFLGACSYKDEADFRAGGYFESMCEEAVSALERDLAAAEQHGAEAGARLKELRG